jgi:hypothetical protein
MYLSFSCAIYKIRTLPQVQQENDKELQDSQEGFISKVEVHLSMAVLY